MRGCGTPPRSQGPIIELLRACGLVTYRLIHDRQQKVPVRHDVEVGASGHIVPKVAVRSKTFADVAVGSGGQAP